MNKIFLEEYLKDPPVYFAPNSSLLKNSQDEWLMKRFGWTNWIAYKFCSFAFLSPLHSSLVRYQLAKFAPPLPLHRSSEQIDDLSLGSKSSEEILHLASPLHHHSRFPNGGDYDEEYLAPPSSNHHALLKNPSLSGFFFWHLQRRGIFSLWKGHLLWCCLRLLGENALHPISNAVSGLFPQAAIGNSNWPLASVDSEHFIFVVSCTIQRLISVPLEVIWVRSISSESSSTSSIIRETLERDGLEGFFPFPWFSLTSSFLGAISHVLPHVLFEVYFGSAAGAESNLHSSAFGLFVAKQVFLLAALLIRVPLDVIRRRLWSQRIYYSKEMNLNPGLVSCLKGMLFEEGIGSFFRGFSTYWMIEAAKGVVGYLQSLGEYSIDEFM